MTAGPAKILAAILTLVLVLTSTSMAVARAGMSLHGTMVLCVGSEAVTVLIGPDGAPQETPHVCPDCVVNVLADAPPMPDTAIKRGFSDLSFATPHWAEPTLVPRAASARAPPLHLL